MASLQGDGAPSSEKGCGKASQIVGLPVAHPPLMPIPPSQVHPLALQINQMTQCGQMGVINQLNLQLQLQQQQQLQWQQQQRQLHWQQQQQLARPLEVPPVQKQTQASAPCQRWSIPSPA